MATLLHSIGAWLVAASLGAPEVPEVRTAEAPAADPREAAAAAFAAGTAAFEQGDHATALREFQRADELAPHPKVRSNIGLCLAALGRPREAIAAFERSLVDEGLSSEERARVREHLAAARASLSQLEVTAPNLAEVVVDNETCATPCVIVLDPGTHRVSGPIRDYEVQLAPGERRTLRVEDSPLGTYFAPLPHTLPSPPAPPGPRPSALTWVGLPVTVVGLAGVLGFGLRARALHGDYLRDPDEDQRRRGMRARDLANAAIAVAGAGALLLIADGIRMTVKKRRAGSRAARSERAQLVE